MRRYVLRRLLAIIPLVVLISMLCFALMHAIPGGPTGVLAENPRVSGEDAERARVSFGLDKPLPVQYGTWLYRALVRGDFGRSFVTGEPVLAMILQRLPATLELMGSAFVIALLVGMGIGILSALRPHTRLDAFLTVVSLVVISVPVFWSGLMAMMLFCVKWRLLPSAGMYTLGMSGSIVDHLRHLVLPSTVLSLVFIASWSRYLRATLQEILAKEFMGVAKAKGLSNVAVLVRHGLRNALAPVLTVIVLNLPMLFTGSVIVETLFSWPGMGRLFYEGLARMDYSRLMAIVFITSVLIALLNLIADVIHAYLDPRIRYAR
jgi:peptide/nickel transport system permease protein